MLIRRAIHIENAGAEIQAVQHLDGVIWAMRTIEDGKWRFHAFENNVTLEEFADRFRLKGAL